MHYHPELKIAMLTPPRTASRSVVQMLERHGFQKSRTGGRHDVMLELLPHWERVVTVVRNHWDTLVSWWGYHLANTHWKWDVTFSQWLEMFLGGEPTGAPRARPPGMWTTWTRHATHVVHFENLEAELAQALPLELSPLPHIRDDWRKRPYWELYTPEQSATVKAAYAHEIAKLGYGFYGVRGRLCTKTFEEFMQGAQ